MAQGIITEWEWRRQAQRGPRRRERCWGPQCLTRKRSFWQNRKLYAAMLAASLAAALAMPTFVPHPAAEVVYQLPQNAPQTAKVSVNARSLSTVAYSLPEGLEAEKRTFTREELLRGKMLYLDASTPVPKGAPAPNTMSVAGYGKGMVPVSNLAVRSGQETIRALTGLFAALRGAGVSCFAVCGGTLTPVEQKQHRLKLFLEYARQMPLDEAALRTLAQTDAPGCGPLMQEYTVELCLASSPDAKKRPLTETREGRTLLQTAWRYGFVQEEGENRWRFRYVGKAHAAAMVFLDLNMKDYLSHLHEKGIVQVKADKDTTYLILCSPMAGEYAELLLPKGLKCEVSTDDLGYALAACEITR